MFALSCKRGIINTRAECVDGRSSCQQSSDIFCATLCGRRSLCGSVSGLRISEFVHLSVCRQHPRLGVISIGAGIRGRYILSADESVAGYRISERPMNLVCEYWRANSVSSSRPSTAKCIAASRPVDHRRHWLLENTVGANLPSLPYFPLFPFSTSTTI